MTKCKNNYKKVGKTCVPKKDYELFGSFSDEYFIIKLALIGAVLSVGGWSIFGGIAQLINLDSFSPLISILFGLIVMLVAYKFGFQKIIERR